MYLIFAFSPVNELSARITALSTIVDDEYKKIKITIAKIKSIELPIRILLNTLDILSNKPKFFNRMNLADF